MNGNDFFKRTYSLYEETLKLAGGLEAGSSKWAATAMPATFKKAIEAVRNPEYDLAVCGEVKRGKSSFINALIGRELLPAGVRETTSQVFRISVADSDSYALVFDDGCREEIGAEDLMRYGTQTAAELEGAPLFRGRVLRWIDVKTPGVFLPPGVHLVDTPGLGALYAAHSELTNRYVASADAVIFVLDSGQPITQPEKKFLERCFEITPNILFIQTKTDQKNEAEWRAIQKRNEELLNAAFCREGRPRIRVYPVSSKILAESAREKDSQERKYLLEDSRFEAARRALEVVMFRATGWARCAWVVAEASRYVETCRRTLDEQLKMLTLESVAEKEALRSKKTEVRSAFQKQWGIGGAKRTQFISEVNRILQGVRGAAQYIGASGTDLHTRILAEINALSTKEGVDAYVSGLPERIQGGVAKEWQEIIFQAQKQISKLDENLPMMSDVEAPLYVDLPRVTIKQPSLWDRVRNTNIDGMIGGSLAALVAGFFLTGGVATAAVAIGTILGATSGYGKIVNQQMDAAKNELRQHMLNLIAQCRNALCAPDMKHGSPLAKVDGFIEETQARVRASLEEQYETHKARMEDQERKMDEQSKLTGEHRAAEIATIRSRLEELTSWQEQLKGLVHELKMVQSELDQAELQITGDAS